MFYVILVNLKITAIIHKDFKNKIFKFIKRFRLILIDIKIIS